MVGTGGEHWAGAGVAEEGGQPAAGDHPCAAAGARGSCGCARPWAGAIQGKWVPKRTQACPRTEIRIDNILAMRTSVRIASIWAMQTFPERVAPVPGTFTSAPGTFVAVSVTFGHASL